MDAVFWREDAGAAVTMLNGDLVLFSEFCFLDYLFQQIQRHEQDLEWEWWLAQYWIQRILARDSSTQLYEWIIHWITCSLQSSRHSSPYHSNNSISSFFSSPWPLPIPLPLQQSPTPYIPVWTSPTITEAHQRQLRHDFLREEFPEDPIKGSRENPIVIDVSDFEDWSGVSIDVREVMLWFYICPHVPHPFSFLLVSSLHIDTCFTPFPYPFFIQVSFLSWYMSYLLHRLVQSCADYRFFLLTCNSYIYSF